MLLCMHHVGRYLFIIIPQIGPSTARASHPTEALCLQLWLAVAAPTRGPLLVHTTLSCVITVPDRARGAYEAAAHYRAQVWIGVRMHVYSWIIHISFSSPPLP